MSENETDAQSGNGTSADAPDASNGGDQIDIPPLDQLPAELDPGVAFREHRQQAETKSEPPSTDEPESE